MNKKAMQMWWIIIGAILALVILFFLIGILGSEGGKFNRFLRDCSAKGGQCFDTPCGAGDAEDKPNTLGLGCDVDGEFSQTNYCCT